MTDRDEVIDHAWGLLSRARLARVRGDRRAALEYLTWASLARLAAASLVIKLPGT